ncbi:MAG: TIM barrel protein [Verrucomicrobiia bacterium]
MKKLAALLTVFLTFSSVSIAAGNESGWPLYIYNFGGYADFTIAEQVSMTKDAGYAGMIVGFKSGFDDYISEADKTEDFEIHAAFYVLYDKEGVLESNWKRAINEIKGTGVNLWLITGRVSDKVSEIDLKTSISNFVGYANKMEVPVSLYPHNANMIDNAEQAVRMIEDLRPLKLDLAFILCHEMRYGNADRIEEVVQNVKDHIGHVVISGSDTDLDQKNTEKSEYSKITLQPLYQGELDMSRVLQELVKIGYDGNMGYINHRFEVSGSWDSKPSVYLKRSLNTYEAWLEELVSP